MNELDVLRWLHILAMVYWLGGEWGVFQTSYKVCDPELPYEERLRHMDTAYRIDIMARTGIISLLPLGLHMGHIYGVQPFGGGWLVGMWIVFALWFGVTWTAFFNRNNDFGGRLYLIGDWTRYLLIPALIITSLCSLLGYGPFEAGQGQMWFSAKVLTYGLALIIGVYLRWIMHEWQVSFKILAAGPNETITHKLTQSIRRGRSVAYLYWILIAGTAFLGATKPF